MWKKIQDMHVYIVNQQINLYEKALDVQINNKKIDHQMEFMQKMIKFYKKMKFTLVES